MTTPVLQKISIQPRRKARKSVHYPESARRVQQTGCKSEQRIRYRSPILVTHPQHERKTTSCYGEFAFNFSVTIHDFLAFIPTTIHRPSRTPRRRKMRKICISEMRETDYRATIHRPSWTPRRRKMRKICISEMNSQG